MKDFVRKLMGLSHGTWLARNLMKHHKTKSVIAIKTKEGLLREADKTAQRCSLGVEEKYSCLLDVESATYAEMGRAEVQYSIFELETLQAQEQLVAKRTGGNNELVGVLQGVRRRGAGGKLHGRRRLAAGREGEGGGGETSPEESETRRGTQSESRPRCNNDASRGGGVTGEEEQEGHQGEGGGLDRGRLPEKRTLTRRGNQRRHRNGQQWCHTKRHRESNHQTVERQMAKRGRERRCGGEGMLRRRSGNGGVTGHGVAAAHEVAKPQPCKLRGEVMVRPRQGRDTAKVHVLSSHLMDKVLRGGGPENPVRLCSGRRMV